MNKTGQQNAIIGGRTDGSYGHGYDNQNDIGHPAWALEAHYLALALVNFICTLSPERIILGGGVMSHAPLFVVSMQYS